MTACSNSSKNDLIYESNESELIGKRVKSVEEAYELYNLYAFKIGFGVRKNRTRMKSNEIVGKEFVCYKEGFKRNKGKIGKAFCKVDSRTGCQAMVYFEYDKALEEWVVREHRMAHNHEFCNVQQRHRIRSHRHVLDEDLQIISQMKESGINLADGFRFLKSVLDGSPAVGFTDKDVYNVMGERSKSVLNGLDAHCLIQIFQKRQLSENEFFYDFEIDENCRLVSFFWRDGHMKADFKSFHDLVIFDTTYRTNKYDMICAPFVGMNNHTQNIMFGCGFLTDERIESFVWLLDVFKKSMDDVHPITIMTDQTFSMATAIEQVFPSACHKLCTWHIEENSRYHLKGLRRKQDFVKNFGYCLRECDIEVEFEYYWKRLLSNYSCGDNQWLKTLYSSRKKWCSAFSKDYFSGGVLSSQRCESTYNSIKSKVHRLSSLCDCYKQFTIIAHEWRSKERGRDFHCREGKVESLLQHVAILNHALRIYTIEAFKIFEDYFNRGTSLHQKVDSIVGNKIIYHLMVPNAEKFAHIVEFDVQDHSISCTCKKFFEVGILCCHCLRIYHINCVDEIPKIYVLKRWTLESNNVHQIEYREDSSSVFDHSLWRFEMMRKFNSLVSSSEFNENARAYCEQFLKKAKEEVVKEVGPIIIKNNENILESENITIQNSVSRFKKGEGRKRKVSIARRMANLRRARYKRFSKSQSKENKTDIVDQISDKVHA